MNTKEEKIIKLHSILDKAKSLRFIPSVYLYNVKQVENRGLTAADIDERNSNFAYSLGHSRDVYLVKQNNFDDVFYDILSDEGTNIAEKRLESRKKEIEQKLLKCRKTHVYKQTTDITGLCFSADSSLLMSCCLDGNVEALDVETFKRVESYLGNSTACTDICTSYINTSNTTYFATASRLTCHQRGVFHYAANLYHFENKHPLTTFAGHTDVIDCVKFHSNAMYLATASRDKTIKLWCVRSFKDVRCYHDKGAGPARKLAFSRDGKYLAAAYADSIKLWDLQASKVLKSFNLPDRKSYVLNLCFDKSGTVLAAGGSNKMFLMWDIKDIAEGSEEQLLKCYSLSRRVYCIKYETCFFSCVLA